MLRLLFVDDDTSVLDGIVADIDWAKLDCRVIAKASSATQALDIIKRTMPDVVFTDVVMPGMDGLELMEKLREDYPHIQVVVLSAYDEAPYVRQSLHLDAVEYMIKPYDEARVRQVLEKVRNRMSVPMYHAKDNLPDEAYDAVRKMSEDALRLLRRSGVEAVGKQIEALFDRIEALHINSMLFITSTCVDMLTKAIGVVKQQLPNESALEVHNVLEMISRVRNVEEMRALTLRAMRGMASTIANGESEMTRLIKQACMIMEEEFDGSITIPLIAERLHISVNHLQTQFKKEMNTTIRQYLTEVRMQQACRLLLQTNDKVSDVGWQVGYKDTDHFVHVFREATGYTPNEYRKSDK